MRKPPVNEPFDINGRPSQNWVQWLDELFKVANFKGSGVTADRPVNNLFVGDMYYDTTLGLPIFVHSIGPVVWHKADGTVA